jgi:mycothiol synthase
MSAWIIRRADSLDNRGIARALNSAEPEYPITAEELEFLDANRHPKCLQCRWVALVGEEVAGVGEYDQWESRYHPRKFQLEISVAREHQGKGIGSALYDAVHAGASNHRPLEYRARAREDRPLSVHFLERRGFREEHRAWESRLDPSRFDSSPYLGLRREIEAQGIVFRTLRQFRSEPGWGDRLHSLIVEILRDVPYPEPATPINRERFLARLESDPNLLPDAYVIAFDGERPVGHTSLFACMGSDDLVTWQTGVIRSYRRRGIALALKCEAIAWAARQGRKVIRTWNDSSNRPMLAINARLGFVRRPAQIGFLNVLRSEGV